MDRWSRGQRATHTTWLVFAIAVALSGCGLVERALPDPTAGVSNEHMPSFASIWLTAQPAVAELVVRVELRIPDDPAFQRRQSFAAGTVIRASFPVSEGRYRLLGLDGACELDLRLAPERETDVAIRIGDDGSCAFAIVREHGADFSHELAGTLNARVTADPGGELLVEVRSLDQPRNPVPDPVAPDEGRLAIVDPLWPGRYEVRLLRDGAAIETTQIAIGADPTGDLVELTLDGPPG